MESSDASTRNDPSAHAAEALTPEQRRWVERAAPRVAEIARGLAPRIVHASLDELTSAGYEALVHAARRYDPEAGVPFIAFAYRRVKGAMIDFARTSAPAVRRRNRALALLQSSQALLEEAEKRAVPGTAADPRSLKERVAAAAELVARQTTAVLLSRMAPEDPDTLLGAADAETGLLNAELRQQLRVLLHECAPDERALIEALYFEGRTMREYAGEIGKSVSTVSRHHGRIIARLGRTLRSRL